MASAGAETACHQVKIECSDYFLSDRINLHQNITAIVCADMCGRCIVRVHLISGVGVDTDVQEVLHLLAPVRGGGHAGR